MLQMGFSQEEIQDSLVNQKYNDVMAAYLLLDYRNSEVYCFFLTPTHASVFTVTCQLLLGCQSSLSYSHTYHYIHDNVGLHFYFALKPS